MAITILPIEIIELEEESYHLFLEAQFSNAIKANLIIDTGASKTVFDKAFVHEFIIENQQRDEEITSSGINNPINDIEFVVLSKITFGNLVIEKFPAATMDLTHINTLYKNFNKKYIAGLIGSDFLVSYNALISYKAKHIILEY